MGRNARVVRKTSETEIDMFLELDGNGEAEVDTGIGFFDHMLKSFAISLSVRHSKSLS